MILIFKHDEWTIVTPSWGVGSDNDTSTTVTYSWGANGGPVAVYNAHINKPLTDVLAALDAADGGICDLRPLQA